MGGERKREKGYMRDIVWREKREYFGRRKTVAKRRNTDVKKRRRKEEGERERNAKRKSMVGY